MIINYVFGILGDGCYEFRGSFAPNGAGAVDATLNRSSRGAGTRAGFSAARTSAGIWTVTLDDDVTELVQLRPSLIACPAGTSIQGGQAAGAALTGNRQFTLLVYDSVAALTDVAAAGGRRLQFSLTLRKSRVF